MISACKTFLAISPRLIRNHKLDGAQRKSEKRVAAALHRIWRIASTMFWPCETQNIDLPQLRTISSGFLFDVKDIPQVEPLEWGGRIRGAPEGFETAVIESPHRAVTVRGIH